MVIVNYYGNGIVRYECKKCGYCGELTIYDRLNDNCVLDIDVICKKCKNSKVLYILRCKDIIYAKELLAKLKSLKLKRSVEVI